MHVLHFSETLILSEQKIYFYNSGFNCNLFLNLEHEPACKKCAYFGVLYDVLVHFIQSVGFRQGK